MRRAKVARIITLSLRLLRQGINIEQALRDENNLEPRPCDKPPGAKLYAGKTGKPPAWKTLVEELTSTSLDVWSESSGSLLFVPVRSGTPDERIIAVCFGTGHHALDPSALEHQFGLKVVLNTVPKNRLRSIDSATLDAVTFQRRTQASRDADLGEFGLEVERDLLRVAAGTPSNTNFAKFVAGHDGLTISTAFEPHDLASKLTEVLEASENNAYQKDFYWVDYIRPITDRGSLEKLDAALLDELNSLRSGKPSDLHLCPPEIVEYKEGQEIAYYGTGLASRKTSFSQLDIIDYAGELKRSNFSGDIEAIKTHQVRVLRDETSAEQPKWSVYKCFILEHETKGDIFILFGGNWFKVSKSFRDNVQRDFDKLCKPSFLPKTSAKNEKELITALDMRSDMINLDQAKIQPKGVKGANIEPCDFFSNQRQFIHLKDGHSSSTISHLWNQGLVSGDAFVSDRNFVSSLRSEVKKRQDKVGRDGFHSLLPTARGRPRAQDFVVIYGILRRRNMRSGKLDLPFFSKVSLRPIAAQLKKFGFEVEIHLIEKVDAIGDGQKDLPIAA